MSEHPRTKTSSGSASPDKTEALEALVGTCDFLKVASVIESGAFLYCGLAKDLFVPIGEQLKLMKEGESHIVFVYRDEKTGRIAGSSRLNKYLYDDAPDGMLEGDAVDLLIYHQTDLGYKAVINGDCWGVLYKNEIFQDLRYGQKITGYIKKIRPDGRIDLSLQKAGYQRVADLTEKILSHLAAAGGSCPLTDKTPPDEIYRLFGVSKKQFKMAVGSLYKERKLVIEPDGLKLIQGHKGGKT
ncbi:MAG: GntR family transcriptional regulator [Candidatus Omnitrophica bacterium]|nr:GntR family transcriptional regulator [Candidatus Omnitrophota bacterium]